MIEEDYVSYETDKLLKEKGFNAKCDKCYAYFADDDVRLLNLKYPKSAQLLIENRYPCVTLQITMKWLRIEHSIHIEPHIARTKHSYGYMPNYIDLKKLKSYFPFNEFDFSNADEYVCITYDKACEATIKYCLENLI